MELALETKIETDDEETMTITIDSWGQDYRIQLQGHLGRIYMPLKTFDEVAAIVAKFRAAQKIIGENSCKE